MILFYDLEILPVFIEFERHHQIALPLDPSSVERAVEWFKQKALAFTKTYVSMFFNPEYQKGSEVPDVVLGRTFPPLREGPDRVPRCYLPFPHRGVPEGVRAGPDSLRW